MSTTLFESTQSILALSSGEAELYAIGSGIAEALALGNFLVEAKLCQSFKVILNTDSTAGKSIATRFGMTKKTRHIDLKFLYMQELIKQGLVELRRILGTRNPADVLTKFVKADVLQRHLVTIGLVHHTEHHYINYVLKKDFKSAASGNYVLKLINDSKKNYDMFVYFV